MQRLCHLLDDWEAGVEFSAGTGIFCCCTTAFTALLGPRIQMTYSVKLTSHFHVRLRSKIRGATPQHTYLLHGAQSFLKKLTDFQLIKKFFAFYETRKFTTPFTNARHLSLTRASLIQSIPLHPISWRSILILSSQLHLRLPSGLFPSDVLTKTRYTRFLSPYALHVPPISFSLFYHPNKILWGVQIIKLLIM